LYHEIYDSKTQLVASCLTTKCKRSCN